MKALLSRAGIRPGLKLKVQDVVNEVPDSLLRTLLPDPSAISMISNPIHVAISRRLETEAGDGWVAGWAGACTLDADREIDVLEIALQFYRERLLLSVK